MTNYINHLSYNEANKSSEALHTLTHTHKETGTLVTHTHTYVLASHIHTDTRTHTGATK